MSPQDRDSVSVPNTETSRKFLAAIGAAVVYGAVAETISVTAIPDEPIRQVADTIRPKRPITPGFESTTVMRQMAQYDDILSEHSFEPDNAKLQQICGRERLCIGTAACVDRGRRRAVPPRNARCGGPSHD